MAEPLSEDAKRWRASALLFRQLAEAIHPTGWRPTAPAIGTAFPDEDQRHAARQAILATYPPVLQECLDVTGGWFETRSLPDQISQPARYWVYHMAFQISEFCIEHLCGIREPRTTIVPYPDKPEIEVCDWLMGEWWSSVGMKKFVKLATTDQNLFYSENV